MSGSVDTLDQALAAQYTSGDDRPSLTSKLAEVMGEVERVPKSGYNSYFKYHFATESDITEAVRAGLAKRHVMLYHEPDLEHMVQTTIKTRNGETNLITLPVEFTFVDGDTGQYRIIKGIGQATDDADKGIYKALTGAVKYLLLKTFLMSTGDDPEAEPRGGEDRAAFTPSGQGQAGRTSREPLSFPPSGENGERLTPEQMNALLKATEGGGGLREAMAKYTPELKQFSELRQEHYGVLVLSLTP